MTMILTLAAALYGAVLADTSAETGECTRGECLDSANTMMQTKDTITKKVLTSGDPAGTVRFSAEKKFTVKREPFDGFPAEVYYKIPRDTFGEIKDGKVFVEFNKFMKVVFVRDLHALGVSEYGMATWIWTPNYMSIMTDKPSVGAGEKTHIFAHGGRWSTESLDKIQAERAKRTELKKADPNADLDVLASSLFAARSGAVNAWMLMSGVGGQMVSASVDPAYVIANRKFAAANIPMEAAVHVKSRVEEISKKLTEKHEAFKEQTKGKPLPKPEGTAANCHHLEANKEIEVTDTGFWFPLNRFMSSGRGELNFSPLHRIGFANGNSYLKLNDDNTFGLYFGGSSLSNIVDPTLDSQHEPTLFVGGVDGGNSANLPDYRQPPADQHGIGIIDHVYSVFTSIPEDYNVLFHHPDALCSMERIEEVKKAFHALPLRKLTSPDGGATPAQKEAAITELTSWLPCAADYVRADAAHTHSYGPFEAMGFIHAILEFGSSIFDRGWNNMDTFCAEVGCSTTTATDDDTEAAVWDEMTANMGA